MSWAYPDEPLAGGERLDDLATDPFGIEKAVLFAGLTGPGGDPVPTDLLDSIETVDEWRGWRDVLRERE